MTVTVETLEKLERKMTLTLPVGSIQSEVESRLKKLARTVKMAACATSLGTFSPNEGKTAQSLPRRIIHPVSERKRNMCPNLTRNRSAFPRSVRGRTAHARSPSGYELATIGASEYSRTEIEIGAGSGILQNRRFSVPETRRATRFRFANLCLSL